MKKTKPTRPPAPAKPPKTVSARAAQDISLSEPERTYAAVPLSSLLAVIEHAAVVGKLTPALKAWRHGIRGLSNDQALLPAESWEIGKTAFALLGLCAGTSGTASVVINNLAIAVTGAGGKSTLDITYNAFVISGWPCGVPALSAATLTYTPPSTSTPVTVPVTAGPPPALPPAVVPAPPLPAVDVPSSGQVPVANNLAALLPGTTATLTLTYTVAKIGGVCDTCTAAPSFTVSASATIV
jgi:hypothetical protein